MTSTLPSTRKPKRMAWTKGRVKLLAQLVAAAPGAKPSELASQFNLKMQARCRIDAFDVAYACRYYDIPRVRQGELPKPQPWSHEEVSALRHWLSKVDLWSVPLGELTCRMREITGRDVSLAELPERLLRRLKDLRTLLMFHGVHVADGGDAPAVLQKEVAARREMVGWLDREQLVRAVGPVVEAAMSWCLRPPGQEDPDELEVYDPEVPENWWDPETFLENVLRGLEDELRRQFDAAGMPERQDEMFRKVRARYEAAGEGAAAGASGATGSLFDPLPSESATDTHAMRPPGSVDVLGRGVSPSPCGKARRA